MKKLTIDELNKIYTDAETVDSDVFAEQRSNILLVSGDHYARKDSKAWTRIRDSRDLNNETKIRLTKNHLQRISKIYTNNIVNNSPGVAILPKNEKEIQDKKDAELNDAVWKDIKTRHKIRAKIREWAKDFTDVGEVATKIFWNPYKGRLVGFKQAVGEDGQPQFDENGQMSPGEPVFSGDIEIEKVYGFNLLRDPSAKSMEESEYLIIRKMVDVDVLKAMLSEQPDKIKYVEECKDETYTIFDGNKKRYTESKGQTVLREYYWRPCLKYPKGYFCITTKAGILWEGELPYGIFPIVYEGFDSIQTSPRHQSIIKPLRPYQIEINRTASKIAETQCSFDDKLLVQNGTKVTNGGQLPGVRYFQYSGMKPEILEGKSGDQYVPYMQSQIQEMYDTANIDLENTEKGQLDPFAMLFTSIKNRKKFSLYSEKFEDFLIQVCEKCLELAKAYYTPDMLVPAIGRNEFVNIAEFKSSSPLSYLIKLEPMSDDVDTMMGKQLTINHALQYVGNQLDKKDIGKMIRAMPFGNVEEAFGDLTLDYDSATNMLLALDRGEEVQPSPYDDEQYMIRRIVARMRMADFKMLQPQIQMRYAAVKTAYEQIAVQKQQEIQRAQSGFIPSGGAKVKVDFYVEKPNGQGVERAVLPAEAVDWMIKRLAEQGSSQEQLMTQNQGAVAEMAAMMNRSGAQAQGQVPMQSPEAVGDINPRTLQ